MVTVALSRHHLDHFLILGERIALLDEPVDDFPFSDAFTDVRELELELRHEPRPF